MLLKPFSVAALVAASATSNAFLIPPQLSELDIEVAEIVPLSEAPEKVIVELDCPGCPVGLKGEAAEDALLNPPPQNFLHFWFTIDHEGSDRLLVNGLELYPAAKAFPGLYAIQVLDDKKQKALPRKLGYSVQVQPVAKDNDGGLELIQLDLQVIEVGDVFVKDIPNVRVKLIKGDGKLMIGGVETTASQSPHTEGDQDGECTTLMCKWIAYAQEKFKQMKNHVKPKPCNKNGINKGWRYGHGGHHGGPAHGPHHGHDNYNQRPAHSTEETNPHSVVKLFKNIFSHILFPVVIGVVAGVSVSLIGMVIGTLVVSMWRAVFRRGTGPSYSAVATKEDEEAPGDEEKSGLMEHQDPPPAYEHPEDVKKTDM
ncbi:hypothetical protein QBC37DRAFT_315135 [Rhypophila decipiens]|uniref:DUF7728 domain-containing protein n=1 Tax=Rhypophila decipiens TaxID=261697 RepID=A0AAN6Y8K1_9PEZI|nr:hypothetical protein QBC37DRAFT_315135 [Rhypophila decipiens]